MKNGQFSPDSFNNSYLFNRNVSEIQPELFRETNSVIPNYSQLYAYSNILVNNGTGNRKISLNYNFDSSKIDKCLSSVSTTSNFNSSLEILNLIISMWMNNPSDLVSQKPIQISMPSKEDFVKLGLGARIIRETMLNMKDLLIELDQRQTNLEKYFLSSKDIYNQPCNVNPSFLFSPLKKSYAITYLILFSRWNSTKKVLDFLETMVGKEKWDSFFISVVAKNQRTDYFKYILGLRDKYCVWEVLQLIKKNTTNNVEQVSVDDPEKISTLVPMPILEINRQNGSKENLSPNKFILNSMNSQESKEKSPKKELVK